MDQLQGRKENIMAVGNSLAKTGANTKLTKDMGIVDLIKAMEPEIKRALPSVMTPERFTRMAVSATNMAPRLLECDKMTFLSALMSAAQLGLEPNTPLGQAYLIPYWSNKKKRYECQFQIGYKGYKDLFYRNTENCNIDAHVVHENDIFDYELGLDPKLVHKPALSNRGEMVAVYAVWKNKNGGFGIEVMSKEDMDRFFAEKVEPNKKGKSSPWDTDYEAMAKKTVIKQALKYAPISADMIRLISNDETVKNEISIDMSEINDISDDNIIDGEAKDVTEEKQDNMAEKQDNMAEKPVQPPAGQKSENQNEAQKAIQQSFFD